MTVSPELAAIMACIGAQVDDPEYQARVAREDRQRAQDALQARRRDYERRIEFLSPLHVGYVRRYCDADLMPLPPVPMVWAKLIAEWDWTSSVILVGPTGTQKSTTATWACMRLACDGLSVRRTTALRVAQATRETLEEWHKVDALVVDELHRLGADPQRPGSKGQPDWKRDPVWDLIDYRYESKGTTIVCATVGPEATADLAGAEVLRRIPLKLTTEGEWK
jgi:hypothetical protein